MIKWNSVSDLHVVNNLEVILKKWFGMEIFYIDSRNNIYGNALQKNYSINNFMLKIQLNLNYGPNFLVQEFEKFSEKLVDQEKSSMFVDSLFDGVKGLISRVTIDGEYQGSVIAYPFVEDSLTSKELTSLKEHLVKEGATEEDVEHSYKNDLKLTKRDIEYMHELVELMSEELISFHEEISKREQRISELSSQLSSKFRYHNIIGKSKPMQEIYRLLEKISKSETTVLVQGENGTGKELIAKAIHFNSNRKNNVFLAINCSAFNDNLLDSELFGHVKGAFTGAVKDKKGMFETAHEGTLFLDEIGDMTQSMQVKLLRVLQEGTFLPVGETRPRKVNVRVIAATNKDLKDMISKSEFREDLYYRINVINIHLPNLEARKDDIPILTDHFIQKRCEEMGQTTKILSSKCLEKMMDYNWPGNIRQLENEIERMIVLGSDDQTLKPDILSPQVIEYTNSSSAGGASFFNPNGNLKDALEEVEELMIREGLKRCKFNKSKLAKELGISRAGLIMKVEKYGLDKRKKAVGE
jgi:two-component system, NtrC family, response regulator HupR/HoxA